MTKKTSPKPAGFRPHVVTLGCADLARSRRFYEAAFGLRASAASQGDIVFFATGGAVLALYPWAALAEDVGVAPGAPAGKAFRGSTLAHNVASPAAVDAVVAKALAHGATLRKAPHAAFWGGYSGYVADPDGHLWEVAFNPFFPFDARGNLVLPDPST